MRNTLRLTAMLLAVTLVSACTSSRTIVPGRVATVSAADAITPIGATSAIDAFSYSIGPDDVVSVRVFREPDLSLDSVRVDGLGRIEMPLIGTVDANGKTPQALSQELTRRYGERYLVDPQVSVNVIEVNSQRMTVEGQVEKPAVYALARPTDLLSAIAVAGGPTEYAKTKEIAVFRKVNGENMVAAFDLERIRSGELANPAILPGDIVVVGFTGLSQKVRDLLVASPLLSLFARF